MSLPSWKTYRERGYARFVFIGVLAATLFPPIGLTISAEDAAATRYVERNLRSADSNGEALTFGDVVWVTGQVRAGPIALPGNLARIEDSVMVVERIEEFSQKKLLWRTARKTVWTSPTVTLSEWQLDADLVQRGGFVWRRASPCTDYDPPPGWFAKCPSAEYAFPSNTGRVRLSYEVTPITGRTVTLIAAVSTTEGTLTSIVHGWKHFAILVWGAQEPHALLAESSRSEETMMVVWWVLIFAVAAGWMYAAHKRWPDKGVKLAFAVFWRAGVVSAPFLTLFVMHETSILMMVAMASGIAAATIGYLLWQTPSRPA